MVVLRLLICFVATAMLVQLAIAANITVGGPSGGWDTSTDLQTWDGSQNFAVGDNLIFTYTPNHDVLEVSESDYDNCVTGSPLQTYTGGNTVIPLTSTGKRYFICGTAGHCSQGMKIEVETNAGATPPTNSPPTPPTPSSPSNPSTPNTPPSGTVSPPPPPPPPPSSANKNSMGFGLVLMMIMVFLAL